MPTYDRRCLDCGHEFTVLRKIAQMDDIEKCPICEKENTERFIGGAPVMGDAMRLGITRPDQGFQDVLKNIHSRNPGSTLDKTSRYI